MQENLHHRLNIVYFAIWIGGPIGIRMYEVLHSQIPPEPPFGGHCDMPAHYALVMEARQIQKCQGEAADMPDCDEIIERPTRIEHCDQLSARFQHASNLALRGADAARCRYRKCGVRRRGRTRCRNCPVCERKRESASTFETVIIESL
jgi:hypothetical protein